MIGNSNGTSSADYVIVVDTSKGTSTTISLTISGQTGGYLNVDWGDGTNGALIPTGTANISRPGSYETRLEFTGASSFSASHTYPKHGIYRIVIKGILGSSTVAAAPIIVPASILISVESFGKEVNRVGSINFNGATNLTYVPPYLPNGVTSLANAFTRCSSLNQKEIARWNVAEVTNFQSAFANVTTFPIEGNWNWNTSNATNTFNMFSGATINDINFSGWRVDIFSAQFMFQRAAINRCSFINWGGIISQNLFQSASLNNCSLINWSPRNAYRMFYLGTLNNCTLSGWRVTDDVIEMFHQGGGSNIYLPSWDIRGITNCGGMFSLNNATKSGLDNWDVSTVTNMNNMFFAGSDFMTANLSNWDISKVTNFTFFMLRGAASPNASITINNWRIASGAILTGMFGDPVNNKFVSLSGWSFGGNNNTTSMFSSYNFSIFTNSFNKDLTTWNTSGITNTSSMFKSCAAFVGTGVNIDLRAWNTSNVTDMSSMFETCWSLNTSVSGWDTSKVTNMSRLFYDTRFSGFLGNGLETWNTTNVTNMNSMFSMVGGNGINANLSGWNTGKVTNMAGMFSSDSNFIHRFAGSGIDNWNVTGVTTISSMFNSTNAINTTLRCNLSGWNLCNCTNMTNFMRNCNIGSGNYDILLNSWATTSTGNPIKPWATGINVHFGTVKYTAASSGARQRLINYGWTITDGGFQV